MRKYSDGAPCIVTGDFNTQPDMPLYQMMTDGQASANTMNRFHTAKRYIDHKMKVHGQVRQAMAVQFSFLILAAMSEMYAGMYATKR